jgi:hypothetical protein
VSAAQAYELASLPAREDGGSRFFLPVSAKGWTVTGGPAGVLAGNAHELVNQRRRQQPRLEVSRVTVPLKYVRKVRGEYVLEDRGEVSGTPVWESTRPGKVWNKLEGVAAWDSFVAGEDAWASAPDFEVWASVRAVCEAHQLSGRALRDVLDLTAIAVCVRAGVAVGAYDLPHPGGRS